MSKNTQIARHLPSVQVAGMRFTSSSSQFVATLVLTLTVIGCATSERAVVETVVPASPAPSSDPIEPTPTATDARVFLDSVQTHLTELSIDAERAAQGPFGTTIAHGFLTLSLLSRMTFDATAPLEGVVMGINYGFDKIRFLQPVRAGSKVRGRFKLLSAEDKGGGRWLLKHEVTVEIEGGDKPALIAEWLGMQVVGA